MNDHAKCNKKISHNILKTQKTTHLPTPGGSTIAYVKVWPLSGSDVEKTPTASPGTACSPTVDLLSVIAVGLSFMSRTWKYAQSIGKLLFPFVGFICRVPHRKKTNYVIVCKLLFRTFLIHHLAFFSIFIFTNEINQIPLYSKITLTVSTTLMLHTE